MTNRKLLQEINDKYLYPLTNSITYTKKLSDGELIYDTRTRSTIVTIKEGTINYYSKFEDHLTSLFEEINIQFELSDPECFDKLVKQFTKHHG